MLNVFEHLVKESRRVYGGLFTRQARLREISNVPKSLYSLPLIKSLSSFPSNLTLLPISLM